MLSALGSPLGDTAIGVLLALGATLVFSVCIILSTAGSRQLDSDASAVLAGAANIPVGLAPDELTAEKAEELLAEEERQADTHIHLPSPSYWPIILAIGLPIMAYGVIYNTLLIVAGAAIVLLSMYGWGMEPHTAPESDYDPPTPEGGAELEVATHG